MISKEHVKSYVTYSSEDAVIAEALRILEQRLTTPNVWLKAPEHSKAFFTLHLAEYKEEHFCVVFLDAQMGMIQFKDMFRGTVDEVEVPIREIAKEALLCGAKAVVLCHNHPSGNPWPGPSDIKLTKMIEDSLGLFDISVYDHIIVGGKQIMSFKEEGLL